VKIMLFPKLIPVSFAIVSLLVLVGCDSTAPKSETPAPIAIRFAPDTAFNSVTGSVVRGDRKIYRVTATRNQQMTITLSANETNAVFDLIAPNGKTLKSESTSLTQVLPSSGDYEIVVSGTRGNALYYLMVEIK
jgi:hypothetical protein